MQDVSLVTSQLFPRAIKIIELDIDGTTYRMSAGDSFFFKAHLKNGYRNVGSVTARLLWVNTPQVH